MKKKSVLSTLISVLSLLIIFQMFIIPAKGRFYDSEVTITPSLPSDVDEVNVTVVFHFTSNPPVAGFGNLTQIGNAFSVNVTVYDTLGFRFPILHDDEHTYHLGKLQAGSYHFEVYVEEQWDGIPVFHYLEQNVSFTVKYFSPRANFTYLPLQPFINEPVTFDASGSSSGWNGTHDMPIVNFTWNFDDGTPAITEDGPVITYNYTAVGTYDVTLKVTDCQGLWNTTSKTVTLISSPAILDTPINKTIEVVQGETFVLPFKMKFNEADDGFFTLKFCWDNNETALNAEYWNFTYEGFVAKFTDGTDFTGSIMDSINKEVPYGYPTGYYRYTIGIYEAYGEPHNGDFWLNATMQAAGLSGGAYVSHIVGDQNITIPNVRCYESTTVDEGPGNCTIHVISSLVHDVAVAGVSLYHYYEAAPSEHRYQTLVSPIAYPSWIDPIDINITVINGGEFNESFTVNASYYNGTGKYTIGTKNVTLTPGASTTLIFTWDVPDIPFAHPYPTYTIVGEASLVPGEVIIQNNIIIGEEVTVRWPGDATGDGKVGLPDLMALSMSYRRFKGDLGYNSDVDYDGDGYVGLPSLIIIATNYHKGPLG